MMNSEFLYSQQPLPVFTNLGMRLKISSKGFVEASTSSFTKETGLGLKDFMGRNILGFIAKKDREKFARALGQISQLKVTAPISLEFDTKTAGRVRFNLTLTPIGDSALIRFIPTI